jgi:hypothetical protein
VRTQHQGFSHKARSQAAIRSGLVAQSSAVLAARSLANCETLEARSLANCCKRESRTLANCRAHESGAPNSWPRLLDSLGLTT